MNIVQVMPEFGLAGAEIMCENLTYELTKRGHRVTVISMYDYHSAITDISGWTCAIFAKSRDLIFL